MRPLSIVPITESDQPAEKVHYSTTETAVELRKALKAAFASVTFSVKSRKYSMGSSIDVKWTDGPTVSMVEKIARSFAGASFDSSVDLKTHHDSIYHGRSVSWGADYVFCSRSQSFAVVQAAADRIAKKFGITDMPAVVTDKWGGPQLDPAHTMTHHKLDDWARDDISDLVYRESRKLSVYQGTIYRVKD